MYMTKCKSLLIRKREIFLKKGILGSEFKHVKRKEISAVGK